MLTMWPERALTRCAGRLGAVHHAQKLIPMITGFVDLQREHRPVMLTQALLTRVHAALRRHDLLA